MRQLWETKKGVLEIDISGVAVERFLNLAMQENIVLHSIEWLSPHKVRCRVALNDVYSLRPIARKSRCRIHIGRRLGWPFLLQRINRRKMLLIGGILFCLLFYIAGHIAFEIQVIGPAPISAQEATIIKNLAEDKGIKKGQLTWNMDFDEATKYILINNQHLTFVSISAKGNKVTINAVKRTEVAEEDKILPAGNIVAKEDAVIEDIMVTKGEAMVKSGDTVSAGQILILGYDDNGPQAASGIVRAKTWYEGFGDCAVMENGYKNSGRKYTQVQVVWQGEAQLIVLGSKTPDYEYFAQTSQVIPLIIWRNIKLPVEVVKKEFREQVPYEVNRGAEDAQEKAITVAQTMAQREIPLDAQIVNTQIIPIEDESNVKKARVIIEVIEDIAIFKEYDLKANQENYAKLQQEKKAERTRKE